MQVRIEDIGPCKKLLHIEVPPESLRAKLDENYLELGQQVEVPGFRKGHVPRKLMEKRFGEAVNKDVHATIVADSVEKALEENSLKMIGTPDIPEMAEGVEELDLDNPLTFDVTVEVEPEFEIPDYSTFELVRHAQDITDADMDEAIERLRRRSATYVAVEGGDVQDDDLILTDLAILVDGDAIDRVEDANIRPAFGSVVGIPCEGLADALRGTKAAEKRTVTVSLPKGYRHEEHEGKEATVEIEVKEIKRLDLPEVTDEWATSLRFSSLDEMKEMLKVSLEGEKRQAAQSALEAEACDRLVAAAEFDLPEGPVDRMVESGQRRHRLQLQSRNVPENEIEEELAKTSDKARDDAVRECKLFFILESISEDRRIFVTEDDVRQRLTQMASNYNRSFETVRAEMERDGSIDDLRRMMRREKAVDHILSKAKVTDAAPDETPAEPAGDTEE